MYECLLGELSGGYEKVLKSKEYAENCNIKYCSCKPFTEVEEENSKLTGDFICKFGPDALGTYETQKVKVEIAVECTNCECEPEETEEEATKRIAAEELETMDAQVLTTLIIVLGVLLALVLIAFTACCIVR